jgi:hypothetical protein
MLTIMQSTWKNLCGAGGPNVAFRCFWTVKAMNVMSVVEHKMDVGQFAVFAPKEFSLGCFYSFNFD